MKRLFLAAAFFAALLTPYLHPDQDKADHKRCRDHTYARSTHVIVGTFKGVWGLGWLATGAVSAAGSAACAFGSYQAAQEAELNGLKVSSFAVGSLSLGAAAAVTLSLGSWLTYCAYKNLRNAWNYRTYLQKKHAVCALKQCPMR